MVSFQCDACADVVKKPKLDQHRSRCGASFTCIDCSKTFPTPLDWKGHTSCISEAEKYQKSLYKPKPNGGGRENPYMNGSGGKFQGPGGSWNRPPPRSQATGANGTPLGTPPRMSPVTAPPLQNEKNPTAVSNTATEPVSKEEPKKHKKRKSEVTNVAHVEPVTQGANDPISREEPKAKDRKEKKEKGGEKEKKEKEEKKDKHEKSVPIEADANGVDSSGVSPPLPADLTGDERPKKSRKDKKGKKDRHEPAIHTEGASNGVDPAILLPLLPPDVAGDEKSEKSKKLKKEKKHKGTEGVETGGAAQDVLVEAHLADVDMVNGEVEETKKKKRKSKIVSGELEVDVTPPSKEEKPKKRKREAEEQEDVTGQEAATERKKKKRVAVP